MNERERKQLENMGLLYKRPMPQAVPYYMRDDSEYPEQLRVSFEDGKTAIYDLRVEQPAPQVVKSIEIIRKMKTTTVGYEYKPRRRTRK